MLPDDDDADFALAALSDQRSFLFSPSARLLILRMQLMDYSLALSMAVRCSDIVSVH